MSVRAGASRARKLECCRPWADLDATERLHWRWQVLHQLAHSRVAFTVARFAEMARITEAEAKALVEQAHHRKWLFHASGSEDPTSPVHRKSPPLWIGRLPARR